MFKFDFDIEDTDVAVEVPRVNRLSEATSLDSHVLQETFSEISLAQLVWLIPPLRQAKN
jgi:hypothetical protein